MRDICAVCLYEMWAKTDGHWVLSEVLWNFIAARAASLFTRVWERKKRMCVKYESERRIWDYICVSMCTEVEGDPDLLSAARCAGRPVLWWPNGWDGSSSPSLGHADSRTDTESPTGGHTQTHTQIKLRHINDTPTNTANWRRALHLKKVGEIHTKNHK